MLEISDINRLDNTIRTIMQAYINESRAWWYTLFYRPFINRPLKDSKTILAEQFLHQLAQTVLEGTTPSEKIFAIFKSIHSSFQESRRLRDQYPIAAAHEKYAKISGDFERKLIAIYALVLGSVRHLPEYNEPMQDVCQCISKFMDQMDENIIGEFEFCSQTEHVAALLHV